MKHSNVDAQFRAPARAVIARERSLWHQVPQVWSEKSLNFESVATSVSLSVCVLRGWIYLSRGFIGMCMWQCHLYGLGMDLDLLCEFRSGVQGSCVS